MPSEAINAEAYIDETLRQPRNDLQTAIEDREATIIVSLETDPQTSHNVVERAIEADRRCRPDRSARYSPTFTCAGVTSYIK